MGIEKKDIISRLKREILPLGGLHSIPSAGTDKSGLDCMAEAFPYNTFPLGAVHEFLIQSPENKSASAGFICGILSSLMNSGGAAIWISTCRTIFPPALRGFGLDADRFIFIDLKKERDLLWCVEEALKTQGIAAVIGELGGLSFTASRRFQLAVEQSRVTGFLLHSANRIPQNNACVSRWQINPLPTNTSDGLPGLGFPRWQADLLKIRNGKPGSWQLEWAVDHFSDISEQLPDILLEPKRKTG